MQRFRIPHGGGNHGSRGDPERLRLGIPSCPWSRRPSTRRSIAALAELEAVSNISDSILVSDLVFTPAGETERTPRRDVLWPDKVSNHRGGPLVSRVRAECWRRPRF